MNDRAILCDCCDFGATRLNLLTRLHLCDECHAAIAVRLTPVVMVGERDSLERWTCMGTEINVCVGGN